MPAFVQTTVYVYVCLCVCVCVWFKAHDLGKLLQGREVGAHINTSGS